MDYKNKIALVTGGTSGIGKEISKQLLQNGASVIVNYGHNDSLMYQTKDEFSEFGDLATFIKADISDETQVYDMFSQVNDKFGKLDFLVNNAGMNIDGYIEDVNVEDWKKVVNVNLAGKFICTKYAMPLLKNGLNASIVNIASRLGVKPVAEASAYCAAESAIISLSQTSALEFSKYGIRVNSVSPGLTITPLSTTGWTEQEIEETSNNNPLKRLGATSDIANAVLFLLSEKASYINGENLNVNGGASLK